MPTDDQVRGRYGDGAIYQGVPEEYEEAHLDDFDAWLAQVRRDAQKDILTIARAVLAGEDTVAWARGAHGSHMSYPHAIGIIDDLIEDLDEETTP